MTDEATPDTGTDAPVDTEPASPTDATPSFEDLQAEVDKWKSLSRKHEDKAKANAKAQQELERLRQESMTEQERAVEAARSEARAATLAELGEARVGDAFRVASAGRDIDVDALLEGVNLKSFLDDDGNPDTVKVCDWVEKIAPKPETPSTPSVPDLGQGARPTPPGLNSSQLQKDLMAKLGIG
jgi:hypothetical protein